ncbi:hypothetical protein OIU80_18500 [Flavobacterium sp. LS1R47]|uniref:Uncharacterized protein n=1 Tax=Flavobacterium frigoritolerans TaxID=2987686 RepID=A0A9X3C9W9_9FLAO|nr:hypothetical protein [Flavobacterium frigoritolerans]MCV9934273.1 hypothetical protein [Flavobacterium frigoritolerans]
MKKNKISFETSFWPGYVAGNPFKTIKAFFAYADLDYYKQSLTEAVVYSYKREIYKANNPSDFFVFYTAINIFLKVCYCLPEKSKKWKVTASLHSETTFHLSSLTKEEYDNPFIVFQKAFDENTLEEFESSLCQIMELSLSPHDGNPYSDLTTPYIHLIKMLDAAALMRERGIEKIKKMEVNAETCVET